MDFASDVTDKLHLPPSCNTDCSGNPAIQKCSSAPILCGPRTYEQRLRVRRNRLSATYTGVSVNNPTRTTDASGTYFTLTDGGNPAGVVQLQKNGTIYTHVLVNTPVYITPPANPVASKNISTGVSGPNFTVTTTSSSCCSC
jgi:hypothetical protein